MTKKKILHIQKVLGAYGSERHLLSLLPRLDRSRYKITFLVLEDPGHPVDDYISLFDGSGIQVDRMPIHHDLDPRLIGTLHHYIRAGCFDMVHTHLIHAALYGTLASRLAGIKRIICTKHDCSPYMENPFYRFLVRTSSRFCRKVIVISQAIGDFVSRTENPPSEKITLIHYGIEPPVEVNSFSPDKLRCQWGIEDNTPIMAAVGRLIPSKGHQALIESLPLVLKAVEKFTLLIAGEGPLEGNLKRLAECLGVTKQVRFLGFQSDIHSLFRTIDF